MIRRRLAELPATREFAIHARVGANRGMLAKSITLEGRVMSKGMNQKKQEKKKPAKSLVEKREAKKAKKLERSSARPIF